MIAPTLTSPSRVLIVDDDATNRKVLSDLLSTESYELAFAENGGAALDAAAACTPDLMLLDVMMPDLDGYEVCRRIRSTPRLRELPIIMVTALDDRDSRRRGLEAGTDDFISKPFDRVELRTRVRTVVRLNRYRSLLEERDRVLDSYERTLEGWTRALDLRDRETEGHTRRVTDMTLKLAHAAGLAAETCEHIRRGALLHDIGKIGVPDAILLKPGKLTPEERAVMEQHPVYAQQMLESIAYLAPALEIPYSHHERWDGSGYPRRLAGEQIPFAARLFAVVDTYDALVSERPYKKAWTHDAAMHAIRESAGSHFDPAVVTLFAQVVAAPKEQA